MSSSQALFRFGVISDVQYCDYPPENNRYFQKVLDKLRDCIQTLNQENLDFVLDLGDLIDRDFKSFDAVLEVYQELEAPVYRVIGNHDYLVADEVKAEVVKKLGLSQSYYSVSHKGWRFLMLDGNDAGLHPWSSESYAYQQAQARLQALQQQELVQANFWNGAVSTQQLAWLETELKQAAQANQSVMVACHYPVFPENKHNLWNSAEMLDLLYAYPQVKAYFNGHNHQGNYGQGQEIHFVTFQGMVETEHLSAFAMVSLFDDQIEIKGWGREGSRILSY